MALIVLQFDKGELGISSKKRTVRPHQKTRSGCLTCRKRHIKCDEKYPCSRCVLAKLECPGIPQAPSSQIAQLSKDELHGLQFFREQTAPGLGGHFDYDFWTSKVLRVSYTHRTLQYFLIGLGSLDEAYRIRSWSSQGSDIAVTLYYFGLQQYGKAIQGLVQQSGSLDTAFTTLISSMICQLFEIWLGDMFGAQKHVLAARNLIASEYFQKLAVGTEEHQLVSNYLTCMVNRYCTEFSLPPPQIHSTFENERFQVPSISFKDYRSAQRYLDILSKGIIDEANTLVASCSGTTLHMQLIELQKRLDRWYEKLQQIDSAGEVWKTLWTRERCLLEIRYRVHRICMTVIPLDDEMRYDDFMPDFEAIVNTCEHFLQTAPESQHGTRRAVDHTTTLSLMFVGTSCRDPQIRRKAISLLYRHRRLEGLWSSIANGAYAERIMMLEEASVGKVNTCADIPARTRIRGISLQYDPGELLESFSAGDKNTGARLPVSSADESMYKRSPSFILCYDQPHNFDNDPQAHTISIKSVEMMSCFGLKTFIRIPVDSRPPEPEEESSDSGLETDDTYDGPHINQVPWTVYQTRELGKCCRMRFMRIQFDNEDKKKETEKSTRIT